MASGSVPLTDYTPDFLPMSIGLHSKRASGRLTLNFQAKQGWFVEGTGAYTWRDTVTLDRPSYFTDDQLFLTDEVAMPDVIDYTFRAGYWKHGLYAPVSFTQHDHARRRRHPPAGHAVRLEPHERVPRSTRWSMYYLQEAEERRGAARRELRDQRAQRRAVDDARWPASSTPSSSRHR